MRYVVRIAELSESSNLWTHIALLEIFQKHACFSVCNTHQGLVVSLWRLRCVVTAVSWCLEVTVCCAHSVCMWQEAYENDACFVYGVTSWCSKWWWCNSRCCCLALRGSSSMCVVLYHMWWIVHSCDEHTFVSVTTHYFFPIRPEIK